VQHVVAPLDPDHQRAVHDLVGVASAATLTTEIAVRAPCQAHITLVGYEDLAPEAAVDALRLVAATTPPFVVRAHGYGFFTGDAPSEVCLFVPVVRDVDLDRLQHRICAGLDAAGAHICGQSRAAVWTPHITLIDRSLDALGLSRAVRQLARRPHPSWHIPLERIVVGQSALDLTPKG